MVHDDIFQDGLRLVDIVLIANAKLEIDPTFAMGWRLLAAAYNNSTQFTNYIDAARNAYENRDRLTERERFLTEALYHSSVGDPIASYPAFRFSRVSYRSAASR